MKAVAYDIIIIGGGPGGSMTALTAAEKGLSVLLVERDPIIGAPVRCAEGVDHKGLTEFFEPDPRWIAAEINGYSLVSPDGRFVPMNNNDELGYILERTVFDRMIAEKAAKAGATVMTSVEAVDLSPCGKGRRVVTLQTKDDTCKVEAELVIAADGVESMVARWAGLDTTCSLADMETCAQATIAGIEIDHQRFHLQFTGEYAPGGYAWMFPKGEGVANVGLGINGDFARERSASDYLSAYIRRFYPGGSIVSSTVGGVQCSGGTGKLVADSLMIVGDAAHLANPITGGGIINALISGRLATETAHAALAKGDCSEKTLQPYQKACEQRIIKMNRRFHKLKEGIRDFSDDQLNTIADKVLALPFEKRTPIRVLGTALMNKPLLLAVLAKAAF